MQALRYTALGSWPQTYSGHPVLHHHLTVVIRVSISICLDKGRDEAQAKQGQPSFSSWLANGFFLQVCDMVAISLCLFVALSAGFGCTR